jgi:hypothetical protein
MHKRAFATCVLLPLGLAACGDTPLGPRDAPPASTPAQEIQAVHAISGERIAVLTAAVEDAQTRLAPGVEEGHALQRALTQIEAALASSDAAGLDLAVAQAAAALDGLAGQADEAVLPDLAAIRLALDDVAVSAAAPDAAGLQQ